MTDETTTEQLAEIEGQTENTPGTGYTPPEGWRVLQSGELLQPGDHWVNWEGTVSRPDIQHGDGATVSGGRYIRHVETERNAATIEELRSEVSYVQRLLGTERRRVTELEELVGSLRTINVTQEKAFEAAGEHNSDLQSRLNAVCAEWSQQAETIRRLQIELDAAQQVPADSPELRQLRADLADMTQDRDTYRHAHELLLNDANTAHERTKAMTVEAIAEWLVPIRTCGSQALATAVVSNLPHIMRSLTGLDDEEIE